MDVKAKVEICRVPNDDFLLALAKDGSVDYLLTGDKDLLEMKEFGNTSILKMGDFLRAVEI